VIKCHRHPWWSTPSPNGKYTQSRATTSAVRYSGWCSGVWAIRSHHAQHVLDDRIQNLSSTIAVTAPYQVFVRRRGLGIEIRILQSDTRRFILEEGHYRWTQNNWYSYTFDVVICRPESPRQRYALVYWLPRSAIKWTHSQQQQQQYKAAAEVDGCRLIGIGW